MIVQIIATVFIVWFLVGFILISIGSFINGCTNHITNIDEIGCWLLEFLLGFFMGAVVISIFVGLIILIWR